MREQLMRAAEALHARGPLRAARDRLLPEVSRDRTTIAQLEADNRRLRAALDDTPRPDQSYSAMRDLTDNERISMILAFTLASDANCVDVGCHEGQMLSDMVRNAPHGHHLAFEPIPQLHAALEARFPAVDVRRSALSNVNGATTFKHVKDLPGYSGLRERTYPREVDIETISVTTERLDDVVPRDWKPDLIKIDVEGAEQLVLEGGMKTISRYRPTVIFEFGLGASNHYGTGPREIHRLLHDEANLRIYDLDGHGPYSLGDLEEEYERGARWQWVAHR